MRVSKKLCRLPRPPRIPGLSGVRIRMSRCASPMSRRDCRCRARPPASCGCADRAFSPATWAMPRPPRGRCAGSGCARVTWRSVTLRAGTALWTASKKSTFRAARTLLRPRLSTRSGFTRSSSPRPSSECPIRSGGAGRGVRCAQAWRGGQRGRAHRARAAQPRRVQGAPADRSDNSAPAVGDRKDCAFAAASRGDRPHFGGIP